MTNTFLKLFALILPFIAGCASQPISSISRPAATSQGEVVIYRESSFIAGAVALTVGVGPDAFAKIDNSEYVRVLLAPGQHEIFVRARMGDPTQVSISLARDARVCLRTSASLSALAKVIVPVTLMASGYHFYLDEVPCPKDADFEKYKLVSVNYAQQ
jgi:hypothetical protein